MNSRLVRSSGIWFSVLIAVAVTGLTSCRSSSSSAERPSARFDPPSETVSLNGFGPIRIGMLFSELQSAGLAPPPQGASDSACFYVTPAAVPDGLKLMVTGGQIARIDVTSPAYATNKGARVGQTLEKLNSLYSGQLQMRKHKYVESGFYFTLVPNDPAHQQYRLVFETDGKQITRFRVGKLPEVEYVEECS